MAETDPKAHYRPQLLQQDIAHALLHPDAPMPYRLDRAINNGNISAAARMDIYKNNVIGGLIEIIMARYPTIRPLVGDEFARAMAREYVLRNAPKAANMNEYAADYPDFIRSFTPAQDIAFLFDVAMLDGLEHHAYYAPDGLALRRENAAEYLPQILAGTARLNLHPSCGLMRSAYPILALQDFTRAGGDTAPEFNLDAGGQCVMVWRFGFRVEKRVIGAAPYVFLKTLRVEQDVHTALEYALTVDDIFNFEAFLQDMLPHDVFSIV